MDITKNDEKGQCTGMGHCSFDNYVTKKLFTFSSALGILLLAKTITQCEIAKMYIGGTFVMKRSLRFFAVLLAALLTVLQPLSVFAAQSSSTQPQDESFAETNNSSSFNLQTATNGIVSFFLNEFDRLFLSLRNAIPAIIDIDDAYLRRHIKRCAEAEESLCEFIFENDDSSFSEYLFDFPVKYIDPITGTIRDITLNIVKDGSKYVTGDNSIISTFSKYLSDGVSLKNENMSVSMYPQIVRESKGALSADGTMVSYRLDE